MFEQTHIDCKNEIEFNKLYRHVAAFALSKTEYLTHDKRIAEEIVQEVFLNLWNKKLKFDDIKQAYFWIYKSCHNKGIDYLRSSAYRLEKSIEDSQWLNFVEPECVGNRIINRNLICKIATSLSEQELQIIAYKVIDGLSIKEISELEKSSERTIHRTLNKIEEKIRHMRDQ